MVNGLGSISNDNVFRWTENVGMSQATMLANAETKE